MLEIIIIIKYLTNLENMFFNIYYINNLSNINKINKNQMIKNYNYITNNLQKIKFKLNN